METTSLAVEANHDGKNLDSSMPPVVGVAAAVLIGYGVFGAIDLLLFVSSGQGNFNPAVLFIPLGFNLLAGRPKARDWAAFGFGAVAVLAAIGLVMVLLSPWVASIRVSPPEIVNGILSVVLFPACGYIGYRLAQSQVYQWFQVIRSRPAAPHRWRWAIAAASALVILPSQLVSHHREQQLKRAFIVSSVITAEDSSTGVAIGEHLNLRGWSETSVAGLSSQIVPITRTLTTSNGICRVGFKGVSTEPLRFKIGVDGYADAEVVIDRNSPEQIIIKMSRTDLSASASGQR